MLALKSSFHECCITLIKAACMFGKIFDVAYTFYKILQNESKIIDALQNDCCMEVFAMHFAKNLRIFLCKIQNFLQVFVITFNKQLV